MEENEDLNFDKENLATIYRCQWKQTVVLDTD